MATTQIIRALRSELTALNKVYPIGTSIVETDYALAKIADGVTAYNALPYEGSGGAGGNLETAAAITSALQRVQDADTAANSALLLSTIYSGEQYGQFAAAGDTYVVRTNLIKSIAGGASFTNEEIFIGGVADFNIQVPDGMTCFYEVRLRAELSTGVGPEITVRDSIIEGAMSVTSGGANTGAYSSERNLVDTTTGLTFNVSADAVTNPNEILLRASFGSAFNSCRIFGWVQLMFNPYIDA
ncbi:hypothetical protein [Phaeocystidibacter luteus]|uniref:Uncharacterized protein n=1 Tax=Phaeocystidibacter luteus TaxID=911197 RepID=A0A6N6RLW0_9FLAO|nr:hypothetical protein [Phaeocystidibacter luteus]KAB2814556.1 hypothetical protein F8C67_02115 [Phaeocystidibacter luteus]